MLEIEQTLVREGVAEKGQHGMDFVRNPSEIWYLTIGHDVAMLNLGHLTSCSTVVGLEYRC